MPTLKLNITNNSGIKDPIWIGFWSTDPTTKITLNDAAKTPIVRINDKKWYSLKELSVGVLIHQFVSGQIYAAYGAQGWLPTADGGKPSPVNPNDPAHLLRYDYVEMAFTGASTDVADLTIIDSWSIPFSLKTFQNGTLKQTLNGLKPGVSVQNFYDKLSAATTPPQSGLAEALPAALWDGPKFVRVIGPTGYPVVGGLPAMPYDLFANYLQHLHDTFGPSTQKDAVVKGLGSGVIANISGLYGGTDPGNTPVTQRQNYTLKASIDDALNISLKGNCAVFGDTNMSFSFKDLTNVPGIYGGNVPFLLNNAAIPKPLNDVHGWICGDLFTGLAVGAIGSTTVVQGNVVGAMPSASWFIFANPAMEGHYFDKLQTNARFYDQWAAVIYDRTNAYGFAYSERYMNVHAALDPALADTLEIVLEPATVQMTQKKRLFRK